MSQSQTEKVVPLSDYNKLKSNYNKIKSRNEKITNENKNLKEMVDSMIQNYESIKESKKMTDSLINEIQKAFLSLNSSNKGKEEYSTSTSCIEYISTVKRASSTKRKESELNGEKNNLILLKKIEELEINYNEICKSFSTIVKKYKILKEDFDTNSTDNTRLLQQIHLANNEINILTNEVNERQHIIERFKEIDKCLVDSTISTMVLNTNEHRMSTNKEEAIRSVPYIVCEPVSTFLKFINKAY